MPDAARLHHLRWRKKKVDGFIVPAKYFYGRVLDIPVEDPQVVTTATAPVQTIPPPSAPAEVPAVAQAPEVQETDSLPDNSAPPAPPEIKVSALSLSSIRAKRELERTTKAVAKDPKQLPTEPFTETDMLLQWNKYAQKLGDKGHKIMESLMLINDPKLDGTTIIHELPNESARIDFDSGKFDLMGYLRGKLHNHDLTIEVVVNEQMDSRKAFTPQDKFNRLNELNPALELLRKTFDLDL